MQLTYDFLQNLTLVLGVAAVVTVLFQKLHQPVVLGYILAGMIIGPHIPIPLIADRKTVHTLSELGVIFLMFSLGLEFNVRKLVKVFPTAGVITLIQCSFMLWLGYVMGKLLGWTSLESLYTGAILAISSTTIIMKAFSEEGIRGKVTDLVFGILIVEDLIAVLFISVLTPLSHDHGAIGTSLAQAAGMLFMFLLTVLTAGLFIVPRLMRMVIRMHRPEITLVASIGICLLVSLLAKKLGYSVALGAFLAGSLMGESGEQEYLSHLVRPVRDMFAAVFFVSVGMFINPAVIGEYWQIILLLTAVVILGKWVGVMMGAFLSGYGTRLSVQVGMSLAQIGEFSFIIAGIGLVSEATRGFLYPVTIAVSALTTLTTPWLVRASDPVASWIDRHLPRRLQTFVTLYGTWMERLKQRPSKDSRIRRLVRLLLLDTFFFAAIVIGAALSIHILTARLLLWFQIPERVAYGAAILSAAALCTPFCIGIIRCARSLGLALAIQVLPIAEDGGLDLAAAPRRVLVVTLQLLVVSLAGVLLLALTQPFLETYYGVMLLAFILLALGISFWRSVTQLDGHVQAGTQMMIEAITASITQQKTIPIPKEGYLLPGLGSVASIPLVGSSRAVGKTLSELNVRGLTGATIIAIARPSQGVIAPTGQERLQAGDILSLIGADTAIQAAKALLL